MYGTIDAAALPKVTFTGFKSGKGQICADWAWMYLQLPLRQWGANNVYLLVLSSWRVNNAENPIAIMRL